jgi:release factor glutamine methyltransferase
MISNRQLLAAAVKNLQHCSTTPDLDARVLLCNVLGLSDLALIVNLEQCPDASMVHRFEQLIKRRIDGIPVAYLTGNKEFWGLSFNVSPEVLIPRPETELLVEEVLKLYRSTIKPISVLELGTGSGCIAAALAKELLDTCRDFSIVAIDYSKSALNVAEGNFKRLNLDHCIRTLHSNWFESLNPQRDKFDLIVSNPPYVTSEYLSCSVELRAEPQFALDGGSDGVEPYSLILKDCCNFILPGGYIVFECGVGQVEQIRAIARSSATDLTFINRYYDLAGLERGVIFRRS